MAMLHVNYHPQTKLREGSVFTPVCDSVHRGGGVSQHAMGRGSAQGGCLARGVYTPCPLHAGHPPTPGQIPSQTDIPCPPPPPETATEAGSTLSYWNADIGIVLSKSNGYPFAIFGKFSSSTCFKNKGA